MYDGLGRSSEVWENIRILAEQYGNSKGYYLYANWLRHKAYRKEGEEQLSILKEALKIVQDGLCVFAEEESLLMLQAKIMKILANLPDFYNALTDWYRCTLKTATAPSIWLLSEMAVASFELGFYDNSKKYFALLDELSSGNRLKFKLQRFVKDEAGALKRFEGKIISIIGPRDGEVSVESLSNLRYNIRFRPYLCYWSPSEAELVKFNIAFDYVAPVAVNLEKL